VRNEAFRAAMAVAFFITELLVIATSWAALRVVNGRDWARKVAVRRPGIIHLVLVVLSFPALSLMANGLVEVLSELAKRRGLGGGEFEEPMREMVQIFTQWPWAFAVLVVGVGPGIGEELWCRAFLGRGLMGRHGVVAGAILTSFFFGAIHVFPIQGTMAALMGLWLHFVYLTTRSLWMPILLHFLNNSLAVTVTRFEALRAIEEAPGGIPGYVYLTAAVLLVAIGGALYESRARLVGELGGPPLWVPEYPGVEWPPAGSGTRVARPLPSLGVVGLVALSFLAFVGACMLAGR
jgi:membrane protease YdiL (CAAX protease family)